MELVIALSVVLVVLAGTSVFGGMFVVIPWLSEWATAKADTLCEKIKEWLK